MQEEKPKIRIPQDRNRAPRLEDRSIDASRERKTADKQAMSRTQTFLSKYYEPVRGSIEEDARSGHRIFRLKGYTTVDKINRKFQQERNQRTLRSLLTYRHLQSFYQHRRDEEDQR